MWSVATAVLSISLLGHVPGAGASQLRGEGGGYHRHSPGLKATHDPRRVEVDDGDDDGGDGGDEGDETRGHRVVDEMVPEIRTASLFVAANRMGAFQAFFDPCVGVVSKVAAGGEAREGAKELMDRICTGLEQGAGKVTQRDCESLWLAYSYGVQYGDQEGFDARDACANIWVHIEDEQEAREAQLRAQQYPVEQATARSDAEVEVTPPAPEAEATAQSEAEVTTPAPEAEVTTPAPEAEAKAESWPSVDGDVAALALDVGNIMSGANASASVAASINREAENEDEGSLDNATEKAGVVSGSGADGAETSDAEADANAA